MENASSATPVDCIVMPFAIDKCSCDGWGTLFSHVDRYGDGGIYEAVLLTRHGFVWCQSLSKEAEGEAAQTVMYFVTGGRIFSTTIDGKQYKPKGMVKLARQFADQCVEA